LWSYGEDVYPILESYVHLREDLRPYTREVMRVAHTDGQPVLRGMFHDFPDDERCWEIGDQFMFGPDLLVAPVVRPGARTRAVYLPRGAQWTNLHGGTTHEGGQQITVDAPLNVIPVFARDSSHVELYGRIGAARARD
jgi:alpha-D-xyloside xylohydrolase